jgi:hypothetical protein
MQINLKGSQLKSGKKQKNESATTIAKISFAGKVEIKKQFIDREDVPQKNGHKNVSFVPGFIEIQGKKIPCFDVNVTPAGSKMIRPVIKSLHQRTSHLVHEIYF